MGTIEVRILKNNRCVHSIGQGNISFGNQLSDTDKNTSGNISDKGGFVITIGHEAVDI